MKKTERKKLEYQKDFKENIYNFVIANDHLKQDQKEFKEAKKELSKPENKKNEYYHQLIEYFAQVIIEAEAAKTKYKNELWKLIAKVYVSNLDIFSDLDLHLENYGDKRRTDNLLYGIDFFKDIYDIYVPEYVYEYFSKYKIKNYNQPFYNEITNVKNKNIKR